MTTPTASNPVGCTNPDKNGIVPQNYPSQAPIYRDPSTGFCYPYKSADGTVNYDKPNYGYDPGLGVGIAFTIMFFLLFFVHLGLLVKSKRWWLGVICFGSCFEGVGWIARTLSGHRNDYSVASYNYFLIQIICLTISPVFFSTAEYGLAVIVAYAHPKASRFTSKKLAWGFVIADILSLLIQAAGGGLAAGAQSGSSKQNTGTRIFLAGIAFQLGIMVVFSIIAIDMIYLARKNPLNHTIPGLNLTRMTLGCGAAAVFLIIRGAYRTAELSQGFRGYLITHEAYFIALDAVMMLCCLIGLAIGHPALNLPKAATARSGELDTVNSGDKPESDKHDATP